MPAGHQCVRKNLPGYLILQRDPDHGSHPRPNCRTGRFCWRVLSPQRLTCRQRGLFGCSGCTACLNAHSTRCPPIACQGPESCESDTRLLSLPSTWSQSWESRSLVFSCIFLQYGRTWKERCNFSITTARVRPVTIDCAWQGIVQCCHSSHIHISYAVMTLSFLHCG